MQIDLTTVKARILTGLPKRTRWIIDGRSLDFDFSPERFGLRYVEERDQVGGPVPGERDGCRIFGMCDYDEGGGASPWISIRERDGFVCGLDIERTESTIFIFNSSLDRFIRTFELLDHYLRTGASLPPELRSQIQAVDSEIFELSDWRETIDFLNDQ